MRYHFIGTPSKLKGSSRRNTEHKDLTETDSKQTNKEITKRKNNALIKPSEAGGHGGG